MLQIEHDLESTWLMSRRKYTTGTDAPKLFGLVPQWGSARGLWLDKRDTTLPVIEEPSDFAKFGLRCEPLVAEDFTDATGLILLRNHRFTLWVDDRNPGRLACTPDFYTARPDEKGWRPIEVKTAWFDAADAWDTAVPLAYQMQMQVELAVMGADQGYFAAWLFKGGPPVFRLHPVIRDDGIIASIRERSVEFWQMVESGVMPAVDSSAATTAALALQYADPMDEEIELPADLVADYDRVGVCQAAIEATTEQLNLLKNRFRDTLGPNTRGVLPNGKKVVWRKPNARGVRTLHFQ
jgi:predicted phage-related endonuclease